MFSWIKLVKEKRMNFPAQLYAADFQRPQTLFEIR